MPLPDQINPQSSIWRILRQYYDRVEEESDVQLWTGFKARMLNYTFFREMTVGKTRFREKNRDFALKLKKNRDFGEKNCVGNRGWLRLKNAFSR